MIAQRDNRIGRNEEMKENIKDKTREIKSEKENEINNRNKNKPK
jgi:hypothetical protein